MSLPKEPRQKMINMMYLVLTALLALNVSAEILNAFKTVDRSLMIATAQAEKQNGQAFQFFEDYSRLPEKRDQAAYYEQLAKKAKVISDEVYNYIEGLKAELKKESGLKVVDGKEEYKEDDLDAATRLLVQNAPEGKGKGKELFEKLRNFKAQLLQINDSMKLDIETGLPIDLTFPPTSSDAGKNDWAYAYFHMTPTIASVTILSKFQNDVRNSEAKAVEYFLKKVGSLPNPPTDQSVIVLGSATKLFPGEELIITAGVGAFSKTALPSVSVDGASATVNSNGVAEYKSTVGSPGTYSKRVTVTYKDLKGETKSETKVVEYTVGVAAGLTVSTDKTRVFYIGLDNPLSVTGAGGSTKLNVNVAGPVNLAGTSVPGSYIIKATAPGSATVTVSDGKSTQIVKIPVKRIPDPTPKLIGGGGTYLTGGAISLGNFQTIPGFAQASPMDFVFDGVNFQVVKYTMICSGGKNFSMSIGKGTFNGASFANAQSLISNCTKGTTVVFTDINVQGPDGVRKLSQDLTFVLL
jgi:gliding motility-associated protein GldM